MKRLIQLVSRLYPPSWQRRYGIEFAALLEDVDSDWHTLLNVLRGVADMQVRTWNFGKILVVAGMLGALVGLVAWVAIPNRYVSTAVLKIASSPDQSTTDKTTADHMNILAGQVKSQSSLAQIIRTLNLYEPEQAKIPLEDIVGSMEKDITIRPIRQRSERGATVFSIQFVYSDPVIAQRVARELAGKFLRSNLDWGLRGEKPSGAGATLEVLKGASLTNRPFSPRLPRIMTVGTAIGLALGTLLSFVRRSMRPAQSTGTT